MNDKTYSLAIWAKVKEMIESDVVTIQGNGVIDWSTKAYEIIQSSKKASAAVHPFSCFMNSTGKSISPIELASAICAIELVSTYFMAADASKTAPFFS